MLKAEGGLPAARQQLLQSVKGEAVALQRRCGEVEAWEDSCRGIGVETARGGSEHSR